MVQLVVVEEMEGARALNDAVKMFHDQSWVTQCRKCRPLKTRTSAGTRKRDSLGRGRKSPLPEIGTIDYFPSIDLVEVNQVSNLALRLWQTWGDAAGILLLLQSWRNCRPRMY